MKVDAECGGHHAGLTPIIINLRIYTIILKIYILVLINQ